MFKKILYRLSGADKAIATLEAEKEGVIGELADAERRIREVSGELTVAKATTYRAYDMQRVAKEIIDAGIGDPAPTEEKEYERYCARIADVSELLKPKLMQMIAMIREELDWSGLVDGTHPVEFLNNISRERYDDLLRGTSNAFRLVLDWLEFIQGAHASHINREKPTNE